MRDFLYPHETMPTGTDEEFVAMVDVATRTGHWTSTWMPRLVAIASRKVEEENRCRCWLCRLIRKPRLTATP